MTTDNHTPHPIDAHAPSLTPEQKLSLWNAIATELPRQQVVPSPYLFSFVKVRPLAPIAVAVLLMVGVGGTAAAAQGARPGDFLFPVDRALEDAQLALTRSDSATAELKIKFAEERLVELRSILAEDKVFTVTTLSDDDGDESSTSTASSTVKRRDDTRVHTSVGLISDLVATKVSVEARSRIMAELQRELGDDSDFGQIRVKDDRIEVRTADERIRVREKDGELRVEVKNNDDHSNSSSDDRSYDQFDDSDEDHFSGDDDDSFDDSQDDDDHRSRSSDDDGDDEFEDEHEGRSSDDDDSFDDSDARVRIEVRVEDGVAEVRMEYGGEHDEFETTYVSRTALITALAVRSGLSSAVISDNLDLEVKD